MMFAECKITVDLTRRNSISRSYKHENSAHRLDFHPRAPREDENPAADNSGELKHHLGRTGERCHVGCRSIKSKEQKLGGN